MARIKCGHCKDTHDSVDLVLRCANWEYEAEADYLAEQAQIAHERMIDEAQAQAMEDAGTCSHGLSAWLCADPVNHYPADRYELSF